jgi:hypothetical protein
MSRRGRVSPNNDEHSDVVRRRWTKRRSRWRPTQMVRHVTVPLSAGKGVQAGDRLVEEEQIWLFGDGQGERQLGALTSREFPRSLLEVEAEILDAMFGERRVP